MNWTKYREVFHMADEEYDLTEPEEEVEQPDDVADIEEIDYEDVSDDGDGE